MAGERRSGLLRGIPLLLVIVGPFLLALLSSVSAQAPDVQLRPKVQEDESVTEAWIAWYDYSTADFSTYVVFIWGPGDLNWREIGQLSTESSTSVRVYGLKPETSYKFLIQVQDTSGGRSSGVSTDRVTKPDVKFLPIGSSGTGPDWVELRWTPSSGGHFEAYVISKAESGSSSWQTVEAIGDQGQGSYRVGGLRSNTGYDFLIQFRSTSADNSHSQGGTTKVTTEKGGTFGSSSRNPLYDLFATPGAACGLSFFLFIIVMSIFANVQKKLGSSKAKFAIPIMIFALLIFIVNGGLGLWYLINEAPLVDFTIQVAFFEMALVLTVFFTAILLLRAKFRYADAKSFAFFTPIFGAIFVMSLLFILSSNGIVGGLDQYQLPILVGAIVVTVGALAFIRVRLIVIRKRNEAESRESRIRDGFSSLKKQDDRANDLLKKGPYPEVTEAKNHLTTAYAALIARQPEQADSPISSALSALDRGESKASRLESLSSDVVRHEDRLNKMRIYGGFDELAQAEKSIESAKAAQKMLNADEMSTALSAVPGLIDRVESRVRDVSQKRDGLGRRAQDAQAVLDRIAARAAQDRLKFPSFGAAESAAADEMRGHLERARASISKSDSISDSSRADKSQALDEAGAHLEKFNSRVRGVESDQGRIEGLESRHSAIVGELGTLKVPGMLVDIGPMEALLARTWSALQSNRPDEADRMLDEAAEMHDRLVQEAMPRPMARPKTLKFHQDSWDDLEFAVVNEGKGVAREVNVSVQGQMEYADNTNSVNLNDIPPGAEAKGKVNVKFTEKGRIQVRLALSYQDFLGNLVEGPFTTHNITVEPPRQGPQSVVIHGDVRTEIKDNIIQRGTLSVGGSPGDVAGEAGAGAAEMSGNVVSRSQVHVSGGAGGGGSAQVMMYRSAIKTAVFNDGAIDAKEREFLDGLKREWGVDDGAAAQAEREMIEEYARSKVVRPAICSSCQQEVPRGWKFCPNCGNKL